MAAQLTKVSKQSVRYRPARASGQRGIGQKCGNCAMFHGAGLGTCDLVRGLIQSGMVCNRWVKS